MWFLVALSCLQANQGKCQVKIQSVAFALCASLVCSPVCAKTFVGVLWPMFGPTFAPGLIELVAELRTMPDVEVRTYLHQSWPYLVNDIDRQEPILLSSAIAWERIVRSSSPIKLSTWI
jgi:hypothetical protein